MLFTILKKQGSGGMIHWRIFTHVETIYTTLGPPGKPKTFTTRRERIDLEVRPGSNRLHWPLIGQLYVGKLRRLGLQVVVWTGNKCFQTGPVNLGQLKRALGVSSYDYLAAARAVERAQFLWECRYQAGWCRTEKQAKNQHRMAKLRERGRRKMKRLG